MAEPILRTDNFTHQAGHWKADSGITWLKVRILRIWDIDWYPGWAECSMYDVFGIEHRFQDKIPVFSARELLLTDIPCDGAIRCVSIQKNADGTVIVDTGLPDGVESLAGKRLFSVFSNQLADGEVFYERSDPEN